MTHHTHKQLPRHDTLILANTQPQRCPVRSMSFEQAVRQKHGAERNAQQGDSVVACVVGGGHDFSPGDLIGRQVLPLT